MIHFCKQVSRQLKIFRLLSFHLKAQVEFTLRHEAPYLAESATVSKRGFIFTFVNHAVHPFISQLQVLIEKKSERDGFRQYFSLSRPVVQQSHVGQTPVHAPTTPDTHSLRTHGLQ